MVQGQISHRVQITQFKSYLRPFSDLYPLPYGEGGKTFFLEEAYNYEAILYSLALASLSCSFYQHGLWGEAGYHDGNCHVYLGKGATSRH